MRLTFSRAGFAGSQRSPAHWAGDENSTWDAYRHSILAGLSAGISGVPFWGWDLGGFSGEIPSAELYLRGAAMAAFCPIMQYHSEYNQHREPCRDRTPWNIQARTGNERRDPGVSLFCQRAPQPDAVHLAGSAARRADRPADDARAGAVGSQRLALSILFWARSAGLPGGGGGRSTWPVYLPEGEWFDLWTHERFAGNQTMEVSVPLDRIPVFVRAGAVIPVAWGRKSAPRRGCAAQCGRQRQPAF